MLLWYERHMHPGSRLRVSPGPVREQLLTRIKESVPRLLPCWIDIRYLDDWSPNRLTVVGAAHAHSMFDLACFMKTAMEAPEK